MIDPPWAMVGGVTLVAGLAVTHGVFHPRSSLFGAVLSHGSEGGPPRVALTFDDGPHPEGTGRVLDILREQRVTAAFFVIGANARSYPDLLRRIDAEDHLVGNHTYEHSRLAAFRGHRYWRREIARTNEAVASILGHRPALFRPPMGIKTPHIAWAARSEGMTVVTWTRRAFDGVPNHAHKIVRNLTRGPRAGNILAMHDGVEPGRTRDAGPSLDALPRVIERMRSRGLEFERLDRLMGVEGYLARR